MLFAATTTTADEEVDESEDDTVTDEGVIGEREDELEGIVDTVKVAVPLRNIGVLRTVVVIP